MQERYQSYQVTNLAPRLNRSSIEQILIHKDQHALDRTNCAPERPTGLIYK